MLKFSNLRHFTTKAAATKTSSKKYEPLVSVIGYPPEHPFSLENIPYAVY